ncbi:MAG TPA: 50S ribosomal protein L9 [Candidatus Gracilibacteria bacterium]|nr:50S ribosomal protein L9 [Candidatus Gracilibacteria bacterium]
MRLIFTANTGSAKIDDVRNVKDGYARYLLRYGFAIPASAELLALAEQRQQERIKLQAEVKAKAQEIVEQVKSLVLEFSAKAKGESLYGSISEKDIVAKLAELAKIEINKDQIKMEHLKTTGEHEIELNLAEGVSTKLKVQISALAEEEK